MFRSPQKNHWKSPQQQRGGKRSRVEAAKNGGHVGNPPSSEPASSSPPPQRPRKVPKPYPVENLPVVHPPRNLFRWKQGTKEWDPVFVQMPPPETVERSIVLPGINFILAFDIEKSGPRTDMHSMVALGACVVRIWDGAVVATFRVYMSVQEGHEFDEDCVRNYWCNHAKYPGNKDILLLIHEKGIHPCNGISMFATWFDHQQRRYGDLGLAITTDNPASDAAWVSHYYQLYLDRPPMFHPFGNPADYDRLHHSNAFARALAGDYGQKFNWWNKLLAMGVELPPSGLHNHDPLNDSLSIALMYRGCLLWVRRKETAAAAAANQSG